MAKRLEDLETQALRNGTASLQVRDHILKVTTLRAPDGTLIRYAYKWGMNYVERSDASAILASKDVKKPVERYASGSSLVKTDKEDYIVTFERMVGQGEEFSDDLFLGLKKLTIAQLKELHSQVAERINASR